MSKKGIILNDENMVVNILLCNDDEKSEEYDVIVSEESLVSIGSYYDKGKNLFFTEDFYLTKDNLEKSIKNPPIPASE
jgi:hypothetical protein